MIMLSIFQWPKNPMSHWVVKLSALLIYVSSHTMTYADTLNDVDIGIVTYGPGKTMMSRFGHTAIVLVHANGQKEFYELAVSNNETATAVPWYLTPQRLIYTAQKKNRFTALNSAFLKNRSVNIRILNLNDSQKKQFAILLADSIAEENALFEFGLYTQNCTTRARDILDIVFDGQLSQQFSMLPPNMSYREHTSRNFNYNPALRIVVDLVSGRLADSTESYWNEAFLPEHFARLLDQSTIMTSTGNTQPMVKQYYNLLEGDENISSLDRPNNIDHWFWLAGFLILCLMLYLQHIKKNTLVYQAMNAWLFSTGLLGLLFCYFWFVGNEAVAYWNENILLFNPLGLLIVCMKNNTHRRKVIYFWMLSLSLAVLLKWLPGAQDNMAWIGLVLPMHLLFIQQSLLSHSTITKTKERIKVTFKQTVLGHL